MNPYSGIYRPVDERPYKISRSKIDNFIKCPRCFYLDRRLGIGQPSGPPFTLNSAVDSLLKAEFDTYRETQTKHPLHDEFGIDVWPAAHELIDKWRENFHGVQYLHQPTNLLITGAIDDLWTNANGEHFVVDYKATAKKDIVKELSDKPWHDGYRRQMEIYQWLLRRNGLNVSDTGYFVYCTGRNHNPRFDAKLEFDIRIFPYTGDDSWVEPKLLEIKQTLDSDTIPEPTEACDYCAYFTALNSLPA